MLIFNIIIYYVHESKSYFALKNQFHKFIITWLQMNHFILNALIKAIIQIDFEYKIFINNLLQLIFYNSHHQL